MIDPWQKVFSKRLAIREQQALEALHLEPIQLEYLIRQYGGIAVYPNVQDFTEWLTGCEAPTTLVAGALLSGQPTIVAMGERLQTLQAAWYPTAETKAEIADLEKRLKVAL